MSERRFMTVASVVSAAIAVVCIACFARGYGAIWAGSAAVWAHCSLKAWSLR